LRVAYLGPAGTFTEEALRASAPAGVEELPYTSVYEAVMAVQNGEVERAVVPIENSIEGSVDATLDALAGEASQVRIAGELVLTIEHCLVARGPLELGEITRVVSHPQATAQCAAFLRDQLPQAERITVASTAEAVRTVAGADESWAALGSRLAASLYGCRVLAEGVEDHPHNQTRFVWLAHQSALPPLPSGQPLKTSIAFSGFNGDSPGALVSILSELSDRGINLSKIESRPRRVQLGHYIIFADLDGGLDDPAVADGLAAVSGKVRELRVLGSYPAAKGSG
jgi:prephenate dehydratase